MVGEEGGGAVRLEEEAHSKADRTSRVTCDLLVRLGDVGAPIASIVRKMNSFCQAPSGPLGPLARRGCQRFVFPDHGTRDRYQRRQYLKLLVPPLPRKPWSHVRTSAC